MSRIKKTLNAFKQSSITRVWNPKDAVFAFVLLYFSSLGSMLYLHLKGPTGDVSWPYDPFSLAILVAMIVSLCWRFLMSERFKLPNRYAAIFLLLALALVLFCYLYYFKFWASSSDSASALEVGNSFLLRGISPYSGKTWGGSPLSPMLGGFILSSPFVILFGSVFIRGIFWIIVSAFYLVRVAGLNSGLAFVLLAISTPWLRGALPNQNDHFVIALMLGIFATVGYRSLSVNNFTQKISFWLSSIAFGIALADRFIYWIIFIPIAIAFLRTPFRKMAFYWLSLSSVVLVFLFALPFLGNIDAYIKGPINSGLNKASTNSVPMASLYVLLVTVLVVIVSSARVRSIAGAFGASAISIATLLLANAFFQSVEVGPLRAFLFSYSATAFNGSWLIFGLLYLTLPKWYLSKKPEHTHVELNSI